MAPSETSTKIEHMSHGKRVFFPRGEESKTVFSEIKLKGRHDEADTAVLSSIIQIQLHEMINCLKRGRRRRWRD